MSPHYHNENNDGAPRPGPIGSGPDEAAMENAAEALRAAEIESVRTEVSTSNDLNIHDDQLESLSIDDLRVLAKELDVPDRATITDQDELIAAIRRCL